MKLVFRLALLTVIARSAPRRSQVTAIKAGKFIDADAGTVLSNQIILIKDGLIEAVGPSVAIPKDATVVDLSGMTVMPGLFDMHSHLDCAVDHRPGAAA